jgi:hypothetical protein
MATLREDGWTYLESSDRELPGWAVTKPVEHDCGRRTEPAPKIGSQEMLFNRQRFWSVAP